MTDSKDIIKKNIEDIPKIQNENIINSEILKNVEELKKINYRSVYRLGLCPECGSPLMFIQACTQCCNSVCGWSACV